MPLVADSDAQDTLSAATGTGADTPDPTGDEPDPQETAPEPSPDASATPEPAPVTPDTAEQMDTGDSGVAGADADAPAGQTATKAADQAEADSAPAVEAESGASASDAAPVSAASPSAPDEVLKTDTPGPDRTDATEKDALPSDDMVASATAPAGDSDPRTQGDDTALASSAAGVAALASTGVAPASSTPPPYSSRGSSAPAASGAAPAKSGSGFFPLLLGGIVAGGIGFGAHYVLTQDQRSADAGPDPVAELAAELADLRSEFAAMPPAPDLAVIEAEIAELRDAAATRSGVSEIEAELDQLRAALAAEDGPDLGPIEARIEELVAQRSEMTIAQDSALESLRATLAENETQIAALRAEVADLRDLAERRVVEAETAVDTALARGALDSLRAALSTGAPYPDALSQLADAGVTVPPELAGSAASGVPTLEMLQERFPDAARTALRDTLQSAPADNTRERLGNFLRAQVGARSTAPREGDDPDAILSRAGAFVEAGALRPALDELESLPETTRSGMASWITGAQARLDAEAVLPMLTDTITTE